MRVKMFTDYRAERRPVRVSLGCEVDGFSNPQPDKGDPRTTLGGVQARVAKQTPKIDLVVLDRFREFVRLWLINNLSPLDSSEDVSFETWLAGTSYTISRKNQLRRVFNETIAVGIHPLYYEEDSRRCKCFVKDESYPSYKHARGIFSRGDPFKIIVGPIFKRIENVLFKLKYFVKKIPVHERPAYLHARFGHVFGVVDFDDANMDRIFTTDYTSFEASFVRELFEAGEFQLYEYMTSCLPEGVDFMALLRQNLTGMNKLVFKDLMVELDSCRMSGEMNTSLGNGFTNLMVFLFQMKENNIDNFDCIFEGDDGLTTYCGPKLTVQSYADLGFIIKMNYLTSANIASFCGQIFDYETHTVITDPIKTLLNLAWVHTTYMTASVKVHEELLRARAMSLLALYPGCPIIQSVAECYMRLTSGRKYRFSRESAWYVSNRKELFGRGLRPKPVSDSTRELMHVVFGILPEDQRRLEHYFDNMSEISTIRHPALAKYCTDVQYEFNKKYVMPYGGELALPEVSLS